jgi:hypothetical protein
VPLYIVCMHSILILSDAFHSIRRARSSVFFSDLLVYGHTSMCMDIHQCVWTYINVYGHTSMCMDTHQCVWTHINVYGYTSMCMDIHQCVWTYINMYGHTSMCMDIHQCVWTYINVYGHTSGATRRGHGERGQDDAHHCQKALGY